MDPVILSCDYSFKIGDLNVWVFHYFRCENLSDLFFL